MAPEEYGKGNIIDHRTNVFTMGSTGFVLLNNNCREINDWHHPKDLFHLLQKAVSPMKENRQSSVRELHREWQAAYKQITR
ncbi:MAG: hypothetical protein HN368_11255 [Spirochaetales bacterium]|jgi:serine/threonine protein kinase, bacterial|nr:hypothetical protein [Spirochaetales bacterium]